MGSVVVDVNGTRYDDQAGESCRANLVAALKDPNRPKTIAFELLKEEGELEKAREFKKSVEQYEQRKGFVAGRGKPYVPLKEEEEEVGERRQRLLRSV